MPISKLFRDWTEYVTELIYGSDGTVLAPNKNNFYAILCNGNIADTSSKALVIASEAIAITVNGYQRSNVAFNSTNSTYDSTNKRWVMPTLTWNAQFGESIQYNCAAILSEARSIASKIVNVIPGAPAIFEAPDAHQLSIGEEIMISADASGFLPSGINAGDIYYVANIISSTQFRVCTDAQARSSTQIALTSSGSNLKLRYAKGRLVGFRLEDSIQTLIANQSVAWTFTLTGAAYSGVGE